MPAGDVTPPSALDRGHHLATLHEGWVTPPGIVTATVGEVASASVVDVRRIVAGEQNEVYDVTLEGAAPVIVRISHRGHAGHEREVWVLDQCAARGIPAPRIHGRRLVEVGGEQRSIIVMEKLPGERLCDLDPDELDLGRVLGEVGAWLAELHSIPVTGLDYLDGSGVGRLATMDDWLDHVIAETGTFEDAARSVGLEASTIRTWSREILDALREVPPRVTLVHNDLQADHVLVHAGHLSGVIDFGEVAAQPAACDFAKWDFGEGDRFPVRWLQAGYGDATSFAPPNDRTYRALWMLTGLWRMAWYHRTGFRPGVAAARDRLLGAPGR